MSPIDTHEEPWLRDALGSLLVDEPPMPPAAVVDDVRRGSVALTTVKRRRTASLAIAAVVLAVAVPVGFVLRAAPNASKPPAMSTTPTPPPSQTPAPVSFAPPVLDGALAGSGWVVVGSPGPLDSAPSYAYLIQPSDGSATVSANVIVSAARQGKTGPYLAACTATTCPGGSKVVIVDGSTPASSYQETISVAGEGLLVPAGSRVVDRAYAGGTIVEVVVTSSWNNARDARTPVSASAVLTEGQQDRIVNVIGDPFHPMMNPDAAGPTFVADAAWRDAAVAALPGTATALEGGGVTDDTSARVDVRLVRDGVGTFVRVELDTPTSGYASPLDADPCAFALDVASCTVLMPWETAVLEGKPVASSVIQVEHPASTGGQGYIGAYTTRTVVLVRGRTVLSILSDSRDVDPTGTWVSSSRPALAIDELLPLARTLPLPYALQPAAESPLWTSKG